MQKLYQTDMWASTQDTEKQKEALGRGLNSIHLEERRRLIKELFLSGLIYTESLDGKKAWGMSCMEGLSS